MAPARQAWIQMSFVQAWPAKVFSAKTLALLKGSKQELTATKPETLWNHIKQSMYNLNHLSASNDRNQVARYIWPKIHHAPKHTPKNTCRYPSISHQLKGNLMAVDNTLTLGGGTKAFRAALAC